MRNETFEQLAETLAKDRIITIENIGGFWSEDDLKKSQKEYEEIKEELHEEQLRRIENYIKAILEIDKEKMIEMYKVGFSDCSEMLKSLDLI